MKKILASLLMLCLATTACGISKPSTQYLKPGDQAYTLRLPSNPSTGYSWFLVGYDHDLLTLKSHQYIKAQGKVVGAPGISVWQFTVAKAAYQAPRLGHVTLVYARPWELPQAQPQTFYFVTQQQG
ncbi:MAG: hypothetical protein CMF39_00275 [Legionellaceae bacterium]|nr:hypothetical protein [Legionellaceae bacterium]|tara:strand:+ start:766 stop:1143 length:378 start_codon:yes stop_codon:yes gene_type:complete